MGALSPVLRSVSDGRVGFWCPGCDQAHVIPVASTHNPGSNWGYNGNPDAPTFTPSILIRSGHYARPVDDVHPCWCSTKDPDGEDWGFGCGICHSFVTDGQILFLGDCTHALAGQTVPIPPWPAGHGDGGESN